jgi:tol-pal system protein YbgF
MKTVRWLVVLAVLPFAAMGQQSTSAEDRESLADIRQELSVVYVMVQQLKRELATTTSPGILNAQGSFQERIDAIEFALQRLTARTEELENRIERVVADGTMRIGDLEFRLVELEGGDLAALGETTTLGGEGAVAVPDPDNDPGHGGELAVGEQDDFDRALAAYDEADFLTAIALFEAFNETYPAGPLSAPAHLYRGLSLEQLGENADAARAYLNAFSVNPDGPEAPAALVQLGLSLNMLGQPEQACVTLAEVALRYPGDAMVERAENARTRIGCS